VILLRYYIFWNKPLASFTSQADAKGNWKIILITLDGKPGESFTMQITSEKNRLRFYNIAYNILSIEEMKGVVGK